MSELDNKKFPYNLTQTQYIENLERQLEEAREEFSRLVDNMGYFTQRQMANRISKVHKHLKE